MLATRALTAALILTASLASAQPPAPKKGNLPKVNVPNAVNPNIQLPNPALNQPGLQVPNAVKDRLSRPDLAVTGLRVVAGNKVEITVANVGRSATTVVVELRVGSSGTGNLDNPAALAKFAVSALAVGEQKVFTTDDDKLVRRAREERTTSQGIIFIAANVDANTKVDELKEANNVMTITTK